jgi:ATP-dependent helicase/nuclease subunit A
LEVERALLKKGIRCKHNLLSRRYYGCTEIQDLTSTLLALSNSQDGYSHLAMLRSPVVGLSLDGIVEFSASPGSLQERLATFAPSVADDAEKLVAMRKWYWELSGKVDRLSAWEVLELIFNRTPFLDSIAKLTNPIQRLENVRKLLMLAAQEPMLSATEFAHYIQEVSYASKESEAPTFDQSDDLVSISTIHAAKGLEWPVVFLADIDKNRKNTIKEPVFDAKTGLFSPILDGYKGWSHFYLHQKEGQKLAEEELRKMYVALTRAKRRLVLVARAAKASEFFRHIESVLGERLGAMTTRDTDPDRDTKWPHDE